MAKLQGMRSDSDRYSDLEQGIKWLFFRGDQNTRDKFIKLLTQLKFVVVYDKIDGIRKKLGDGLQVDPLQLIESNPEYQHWVMTESSMETGYRLMRESVQKLTAHRDASKVHIENLEKKNEILKEALMACPSIDSNASAGSRGWQEQREKALKS